MKALIRYKLVVSWMTAVFAMSFIVFNYNIQAKITEKNEYSDAVKNSYKYQSTVALIPAFEFYDADTDYRQLFVECISEFDGHGVNITIVDINARLDDYGMEQMAALYIAGSQPKFPLIWGRYPDEEHMRESEKYVVLGRNKLRYAYNEAGKQYVKLNGEKYQVIGCMSTGRSHYLDNDIIIFDKDYDGLFWNTMNTAIKMGMVNIAFESEDNADMGDIVSDFQAHVKDASNGALEVVWLSDSDNLKMRASHVPEVRYRRWAWLAYAFSIVTTLFMCQYWMIRRKKEFAIKKTYGFSGVRIIWQFLTEILAIMLTGIVIGIFIIFINHVFTNNFMVFDLRVFGYLMLIVLSYICITLFLISIYPIIWLHTVPTVQLMNGRKGNN
ncbi:MAG: ABC transporter permease [Clostridium sp.]|nr:ABC transporter permease [Clostridium sp.]